MNAPRFRELDIFGAPLEGLGLIEASAGTGKTWTITGLYVRLIVEKGYSVEQILVLTYTKAATAELRERIRRRLTEALAAIETGQTSDVFCRTLRERLWASSRQSAFAASLPHSLPAEEGIRIAAAASGNCRKRQEQTIHRLRMAIRNFDEATIFTIHGFCQRVLTESAFESGVEFESELTQDDSSIVQEIVDDFWRRETSAASPLWVSYLADQGQTPDIWREAVRAHLDKPYLALAPLPKLEDTDALALSFVRAFAAARNMWNRQRKEITGLLQEAAIAKTLSNTSYKPAALPQWFERFDEYFSPEEAGRVPPDKLVKLTRAELAKGTAKNKALPEHPFFSACAELIEAAARLEEHFKLKLVEVRSRLIGECNDELPRRKSGLGLVSYNDLLNRLAQALRSEGGGDLAAALRERYPAALIDEFQDTDPVQYRIFQAIYGDGERPVFLVGDPKQAIYGFRGADVFSYLQARGQAKTHYTLDVNQRSDPKLIKAVNALFLRSKQPFLFEDIDYPEVKAANKNRPRLEVEGDGGEPFRFFLTPPNDKPLNKEEANALAAQATATEIARLLNLAAAGKARLMGALPSPQPSTTAGNKSQALGGGDIAVLVPTHRQGALVQEALAERGIPAVRQGQDNIFSSAEAVELERILLAIAEPQRESRVKSALATEIVGFSAAELFALQNGEGAWENRLAEFSRYREIWLRRGFMPMFRHWLEESGVVERLLRYRGGERRLTNLLHLAELLHVRNLAQPGPERLLGWFSRAMRDPEGEEEALLRLESDADRVKIVTIHTSKGLEYPIVFCPFLWDGSLWKKGETAAAFHDPARGYQPVLNLGTPAYASDHQLASVEKLAEKLRLLYVALTRAKHRCYAVWGNISGLETSALAWLLHGPVEPNDDPLAGLASALKGLGHAAIERTLQELARQSEGAIAITSLVTDEISHSPSAAPAQDLKARSFSRPYLRPNWRISSFSALAQGRHSEGPDYDTTVPDWREQPPDQSIFAFPRGAEAGRCLHSVFEEWEFESQDEQALERLIRRKLKAHAIDESWTPVVACMVRTVLDADLDGAGLRLANIGARQRLAELEFTYPLRELEAGRLKRILAAPDNGLPPHFSKAAESLHFDTVKGYMKGFIDLAFQADGRYYLLDYKSNWLGPDLQDYALPQLLRAMAGEHYYLQYLIYSLALHRYLRLRRPDYDYETHFGGVFYLFLRGIGRADPSGRGIFWDRPGPRLIESLDELLA